MKSYQQLIAWRLLPAATTWRSISIVSISATIRTISRLRVRIPGAKLPWKAKCTCRIMQNWCTKHQLSHHSSRTDSVSNSFRDYRTFFNHSILSSASIRYRAWLIPYLSAIVDASYCSVPRSITVFVYIDVRLSISFVFLFNVLLDLLILANINYTSIDWTTIVHSLISLLARLKSFSSLSTVFPLPLFLKPSSISLKISAISLFCDTRRVLLIFPWVDVYTESILHHGSLTLFIPMLFFKAFMTKDSYVDRMHFARRLVIQIFSEVTT